MCTMVLYLQPSDSRSDLVNEILRSWTHLWRPGYESAEGEQPRHRRQATWTLTPRQSDRKSLNQCLIFGDSVCVVVHLWICVADPIFRCQVGPPVGALGVRLQEGRSCSTASRHAVVLLRCSVVWVHSFSCLLELELLGCSNLQNLRCQAGPPVAPWVYVCRRGAAPAHHWNELACLLVFRPQLRLSNWHCRRNSRA